MGNNNSFGNALGNLATGVALKETTRVAATLTGDTVSYSGNVNGQYVNVRSDPRESATLLPGASRVFQANTTRMDPGPGMNQPFNGNYGMNGNGGYRPYQNTGAQYANPNDFGKADAVMSALERAMATPPGSPERAAAVREIGAISDSMGGRPMLMPDKGMHSTFAPIGHAGDISFGAGQELTALEMINAVHKRSGGRGFEGGLREEISAQIRHEPIRTVDPVQMPGVAPSQSPQQSPQALSADEKLVQQLSARLDQLENSKGREAFGVAAKNFAEELNGMAKKGVIHFDQDVTIRRANGESLTIKAGDLTPFDLAKEIGKNNSQDVQKELNKAFNRNTAGTSTNEEVRPDQPEKTQPATAPATVAIPAAEGVEAKAYAGVKKEDMPTGLKQNQVDELQAALKKAGVDIGKTGKNHDGVDDQWGPKSQAALVKAAKDAGIADYKTIDFSDPKNPALVKLQEHLAKEAKAHEKPAPEQTHAAASTKIEKLETVVVTGQRTQEPAADTAVAHANQTPPKIESHVDGVSRTTPEQQAMMAQQAARLQAEKANLSASLTTNTPTGPTGPVPEGVRVPPNLPPAQPMAAVASTAARLDTLIAEAPQLRPSLSEPLAAAGQQSQQQPQEQILRAQLAKMSDADLSKAVDKAEYNTDVTMARFEAAGRDKASATEMLKLRAEIEQAVAYNSAVIAEVGKRPQLAESLGVAPAADLNSRSEGPQFAASPSPRSDENTLKPPVIRVQNDWTPPPVESVNSLTGEVRYQTSTSADLPKPRSDANTLKPVVETAPEVHTLGLKANANVRLTPEQIADNNKFAEEHKPADFKIPQEAIDRFKRQLETPGVRGIGAPAAAMEQAVSNLGFGGQETAQPSPAMQQALEQARSATVAMNDSSYTLPKDMRTQEQKDAVAGQSRV